jgi:hypothetical protein
MSTQTLAFGNTPINDLRKRLRGISGMAMIPPANKVTAILAAEPGSGKSTFLQSVPDSLYLNFDLTSTLLPKPSTCIWPGLDPDTGAPIEQCDAGDPKGYQCKSLGGMWVRPVTLSWDAALSMRDMIVSNYKSGSPWPACVILDCGDNAFRFIEPYIANKQKAGATTIDEAFPGKFVQTGIARKYDELTDFFASFRNIGCGCILALQLTDKFITLDEDAGKRVFQRGVLQSGDSFRGRVRPLAELFLVLSVKTEQVTHRIPKIHPLTKEPLMDKGQQLYHESTTTERRHYLAFTSNDDQQLAKNRRGLNGAILLSKDNGWADFTAAYDKARTEETK